MGVTRVVKKEGDQLNYPKAGDKVGIFYTGTLVNGKKFDSSVDRGIPFECVIGRGNVIKGWDEGVPLMSLGEEATFTITPDYAYAERGFAHLIPPNSTLVFDMHLISINNMKA
ncbi:hypothetical protein H072_4828 [Dactylellina haptotyla CBS 200.50]|uniref:peptidylprolyl isomerase n=1 Tax=Dactylellina haptotyla (strain CBS 200.50) TaxID=1284197 RepID=S8AJC0_DACHA|nr:hypothetical protein H072_4828 [Dactylellina haptotyla CBS 200.50]